MQRLGQAPLRDRLLHLLLELLSTAAKSAAQFVEHAQVVEAMHQQNFFGLGHLKSIHGSKYKQTKQRIRYIACIRAYNHRQVRR